MNGRERLQFRGIVLLDIFIRLESKETRQGITLNASSLDDCKSASWSSKFSHSILIKTFSLYKSPNIHCRTDQDVRRSLRRLELYYYRTQCQTIDDASKRNCLEYPDMMMSQEPIDRF